MFDEHTLPRPRRTTGQGVCQGATFNTEDHPLPVWCYWTYRDDKERFQSILIQITTPSHYRKRVLYRTLLLSKYASPKKAALAAAKEVVRWGVALYGVEFTARYQQAVTNSELKANAVLRPEGIEQAKQGLTLPEGVYCRIVHEPKANGGERVRVRIMATWREGIIGKRRQREKGFDVTAKRTLEQAIEQAIEHRKAMLKAHGTFLTRYDKVGCQR